MDGRNWAQRPGLGAAVSRGMIDASGGWCCSKESRQFPDILVTVSCTCLKCKCHDKQPKTTDRFATRSNPNSCAEHKTPLLADGNLQRDDGTKRPGQRE